MAMMLGLQVAGLGLSIEPHSLTYGIHVFDQQQVSCQGLQSLMNW